jgi:hypothetical protein
MELIQKKCPCCNDIFSSYKQDKIYCSSNCRKLYNRKLPYIYINTCPDCNKQKKCIRQNTYIPAQSKLGNSKCGSCRQKGKVVKERIDYSKYDFNQSDDIFIRNCPECNDVLTYKKKYYAYSACKKNGKCASCSVKGSNNGKIRYAFKKYNVSSIEELDALLPEKELYYKNVWRYTYKQPLSNLENYRPERKNGYAIDHIYPISHGFKNKIPYELIGDISNLQMLLFRENESKSDKIITIPDLIKKYLDM